MKSSGAHISRLSYVQRMHYCFGDWGHTVGRADTGAAVCRGADLHNSGIIQGQQDASSVEARGGFTDSPLGPRQ